MTPRVLTLEALQTLVEALARHGYQVVGPALRDGAIVLDDIADLRDLPAGWSADQGPARYRLRRRTDTLLFAYTVGPDAWKRYLFPPEARLWRMRRDNGHVTVETDAADPPRRAFLGVRACELHAIAIQDRVLLDGPYPDPDYRARRARVLLIAVNCREAGGTCFCASMGAGPRVTGGFDLALTELQDRDRHEFFWISNLVMVEAKQDVINELMLRMEVIQMDLDAILELDKPVEVVENAPEGTESVEDGLKIINAHLLWAMGITGQGRLVMGIDTGVQLQHPALQYKWRGNHVPYNQAWFDPSGGTTTPNDCDYHGSHTMGTMVGRSITTADTVGVAINAEWIAAKTICSSSHTTNSIAAFQWALNPDGNSSTPSQRRETVVEQEIHIALRFRLATGKVTLN